MKTMTILGDFTVREYTLKLRKEMSMNGFQPMGVL
jgi:hypothetical protein